MKSFWSIGNRKIGDEAGFTLVEMIVTLSIAAIVTALVIGNLGTVRFRLALTRSAQRLSLDLHRAESDSLTSREFKTSGVPAGWGMHFYGAGSTSYTIFADLGNPGDNIRAADGSEDLESFNFEPGVTMTSSNITDIVFIPPDPTIIFTPAVISASIVLSTIDGSLTRTVTINKFGAIPVQ